MEEKKKSKTRKTQPLLKIIISLTVYTFFNGRNLVGSVTFSKRDSTI